MNTVTQVYLLLISQGFYLGSVGQSWTYPFSIPSLIGSCVEIPCTYDPDKTSGPSSAVWYLYDGISHQEILNTKDSSSVLEQYRGRTSLVPGKSCTLRIDPVRREDIGRYYPGIAEDKDRNAYKEQKKTLYLNITDKVDIQLQGPELMTEGEATTMQCIVAHTCPSRPPSLQWNKPGRVTHQSLEFFGLFNLEESKLTFLPSHVDDGSPIGCTATFSNELKAEESITLNVNHAATGVHITARTDRGSTVLTCDFLSSRPDVTHFTWMKDGSILYSNAGKNLTLYEHIENNGRYICIAHNSVGNSSSEEIYHQGEESQNYSYTYIILSATIGTICLLLLVLVVYTCWRKKQKMPTSTKAEDPYTDLRLSDVTDIYHQLEPVTPASSPAVTSDVGETHPDYENIRRPHL